MEREKKVARMSSSEKRTLAIMRSIPFVVPFIDRVNVSILLSPFIDEGGM